MKKDKLKVGGIYYFDMEYKAKGVFMFKEKLGQDYFFYFAPIGDTGDYVFSHIHRGLIGFGSDVGFKKFKL